MKIMLVSPPAESDLKKFLGVSGQPLGLAYLAAVLEKMHDVSIIDCPTMNYSFSDFKRIIKKSKPDIVGITSVTSAIYGAYKTAKTAKEENPNCTVIIGGPHVTFTAEQTLRECRYIDIIVRGEGEQTILEIANFLEKKKPKAEMKKIRGISFRIGNKIINNPDRGFIKNLDSLPHPARHLLPMEKYKLGRYRFGIIMTSRGCPYNCIYCSSSLICGNIWRSRSPENVAEELRMLKDEYSIKEVEFMDDTFTLNQKRAEEICNIMTKEKIDLSWTCSSRVNTISRGLARKLKKAGCHTIYFGIESGSQRILDKIGKGITLRQSVDAIKTAKQEGIKTLGSFILGIPGETKKTINKTIKFARILKTDFAQFTICTPYPGTRIFDEAKRKGLLLTEDWSKYTTLEPVMSIPGLSYRELKKLLRKAYLSFYIRPGFLLNQIRAGNIFLFKKIIEAGITYLKT